MTDSTPTTLDSALRVFAASERILIALDFDGVLAPIVARPQDARPLPGSREPMQRLVRAARVHLALVSGRALSDLRALADPAAGMLLVGSHGAELGTVDGHQALLDDDRVALLDKVVAGLEDVVAANPGTHIEVKPAGAVLHTRRAGRDAADAATRAALEGPAALDGVHLTRGKEVVELSVVATDKGEAVEHLRRQVGADAVLYVGDDVTDEHAFAVLDPANGDVRVKVGDGDSAADHRIAGPDEVVKLLAALAELRA